MKAIIKEYLEETKNILKNKKIIITILLVTILSFGFTITHESVGPDDLCFDRYFKDTYILTQGRWVTFILYNVLHITSFSPFWMELLTTIVLFFTAITVCAFMKKQFKDEISDIVYLIFSCLFISFPVLKEFFIYQIPNLAIALSNMLMIILTILIYENYYNIKSKKLYFILGMITAIPICTYESCIQTFLVMIFFQILIQAKIKTENIKDMFIYLLKAVIQLVIGIVLYKVVGEVIVKMLELTGTLQNDYAQHTTIIDVIKSGKIKLWFAKVVVTAFVTNKLYINIFIGVEVAVFILSISDSRQNKNAAIFLATLGMILSNYIFTVLMENPMLRTNYAWALSMGLLSIYLYMLLKNMKYMSKIILVIFALITIYNTRSISNSFYQEYLGYEKDKNDAYRIAQEIYIQCKDVTKPICFTWEGRQINEDDKYIDGRISVFKWGLTAFDEKSTETIKFINSLGYNFLGATKEQLLEARDEYSQVREIIDKGQWVIELDNYIVVNLKFMQ